ncbi:MAG: diguanylate cyclase [Epsilonproteobacteria bacterium]|nr:diguanylate cyclase [Campylobacterota bacterium]
MLNKKGDVSFPLKYKWDGVIICNLIHNELIVDDILPKIEQMNAFLGSKCDEICYDIYDEAFIETVLDVNKSAIPKIYEKRFNRLEKLQIIITKISQNRISLNIHNRTYQNLLNEFQKIEDMIVSYTRSNENIFEKTIRQINESIVDTFDVSCSSFWMHYNFTNTIECVDIYSQDSSRHRHDHDPIVVNKDDPYFQNLFKNETSFYNAKDPGIMVESLCYEYVKKYGIEYKYDFIITYNGRFIAMMCIETTKKRNFFTVAFQEYIQMLKKLLYVFIDTKFKKEVEEKFKAIEKNEHTGILIYRDKVLYANQAVLNMNGFTFKEMQQFKTWELFAPEYREKFKNVIQRRMKGEQFPKSYSDVRVISKSGKILTARLSAETILYEGQYVGISTVMNITDLVEAREQLHKLATTDGLTKIYNRRKMHDEIDTEILLYQRYKDPFGVIMFDIDYFKNINDAYGHDIGDEVLIELTNLIKSKIRQTDSFARWGGEEFLILARSIEKYSLFDLAEELRLSVESVTFSSFNLAVTISLGLTMYRDGDTKEDILKRVDIALYKAKKGGRNRVVLL